MTQRSQHKAATRSKILGSARVLFREHGANVATRDISAAAGVSTGSIYSNWPGGIGDLFAEAMGRPLIDDAKGAKLLAALRKVREFIEDEVEDRGAAGSIASDYQDEAKEALEAVDAALAAVFV